MFTRSELKSRAKQVLKTKYWMLLLVSVVLSLFTSTNASTSANQNGVAVNVGVGPLSYSQPFNSIEVSEIALFILAFAIILSIVRLIVGYSMEYGCQNYFKKAHYGTESGTIFDGFKDGRWKHIVGTFFLRDIKIVLFTFLLVIPGIIKAYQLRFVPYLVEDHPEMSASEIHALSTDMARGIKLEMFILDLSFILWTSLGFIIGIFTFGLGNYLILPYIYQTDAELYIDIKNKYNSETIVIDAIVD